MPAALKSLVQWIVYAGLFLFAGGLMLLGKADAVLVERLRLQVSDVATPVLAVLSEPVDTLTAGVEQVERWVHLAEENARLREERERLLRWQAVAQRLEAENADLRRLLDVVPEPDARYRTARVIADRTGTFAQSVLVSAGTRDGVGKGQVAVAGEGLVGRVVGASERASRVLLITDLNSRVPVFVGEARARAVLAGDNSDRPKLIHVVPGSEIDVGDAVITSGIAGGFPAGLPVGVVQSVDDGRIRVEPNVDRARLEYVRLVDFGTDTLQIEQPSAADGRASAQGKASMRADVR